jgi:hypothetical protein
MDIHERFSGRISASELMNGTEQIPLTAVEGDFLCQTSLNVRTSVKYSFHDVSGTPAPVFSITVHPVLHYPSDDRGKPL